MALACWRAALALMVLGPALLGPSRARATNDPFYGDQWHLSNTGQNGGTPGEDLNVGPIYECSAPGVVVAVVDDAVEVFHEDLFAATCDQLFLHTNFYEPGDDPGPTASDEAHGTAVAGIIAAAAHNGIGVAGVSPSVRLVGIRMGPENTDANFAKALIHHCDQIDIYNLSLWWRQHDVLSPEPLPLEVEQALEHGTAHGQGSCRNGLGSIYVVAAGNDNAYGGNANLDNLANSRYTIAVAASGPDGGQTAGSNEGANILVCAPGSGIATTDLSGAAGYNDGLGAADYPNANYTNGFGGTSAAVPMVSAIVARMLQANPALSWRDVQHVLIETAAQNDPADADWTVNGAGYAVNHKYGFGRVDAAAAVAAARTWTPAGLELTFEQASSPNVPIPDNSSLGVEDAVSFVNPFIDSLETVEVTFISDHPKPADLEITLISPQGTASVLVRPHLSMVGNYASWRFSSVRHFGEDPAGTWTLRVKDLRGAEPFPSSGSWLSWSLRLYGTHTPPAPCVGCACPGQSCQNGQDLNILFRAKGTPAGGQWPQVTVSSHYGQCTSQNIPVASTEFQLYEVNLQCQDNPSPKGRVKLAYLNDGAVGAENRDLWIDYVVVDGQQIEAEGPGVRYLVKPDPAADGKHIRGQEALWWRGVLEVPLDWSFVDVEASAQWCDGWPQMEAYVNNRSYPEPDLTRMEVTNNALGGGQPRVVRHYLNTPLSQYYIKYINDKDRPPVCDRNLFVHSVTFGALRVPGSDPALFYLNFNDQLINSGSGDMYWGGRLIFDNVLQAPTYAAQAQQFAEDALPNVWEELYGLSTTLNDEAADPDGDGLSNLQEYALGTNPQSIDSDGDGILDAHELVLGLNPAVHDAGEDMDGDLLANYEEYLAGTDPADPDTDGDGLSDRWELRTGHNPLVQDYWEDDMTNPARWRGYHAQLTSTSTGAAVLTEAGPDQWGKQWQWVGVLDVSLVRYLFVRLLQVSGVAKIAISGGYDSHYQELIGTGDPGEYIADISAWSGNGPGPEEVFVQIIAQGEGSSVVLDRVTLSSVPPEIRVAPPVTAWSDDMTDATRWGLYRSTLSAGADGTAHQQIQSGAPAGKAWAYAGVFDVDQYSQLTLSVAEVAGTAKIAVSGPYDGSYWEVLTIPAPGSYTVDLTQWPGNVWGPEEVFVQLILEGEGAHARYSDLAIHIPQ